MEAARSDIGAPERRLIVIDVLRGTAVLGMILFHARWDAAWLGLTRDGPAVGPGWQWFGNAVAATFLALSGVSMVLSDRFGTTAGRVRRRLAVLAFAAASVTAVTLVVAPDRPILFGILHCLLVGNVLARPFVRQPLGVPLGIGAALLLLPAIMPKPARFDGVAWVWLGLGRHVPPALDYRPLMPWAGAILLGVVLSRVVPVTALYREGTQPWVTTWMAWAGRHSLAIYLSHQAVLLPILALLADTAGVTRPAPGDQGWRPAFERECRATCEKDTATNAVCATTCHCAVQALEPAGPYGDPPAPDRSALAAIAARCLRSGRR